MEAAGTAYPYLTSLAIIKVSFDNGRDYIGNFLPFVGHCLLHSGDDVVALGPLQSEIKAQFGLDIPQGALKTILSRATRDGVVRRDHGVYYPVADKLGKYDLGGSAAGYLRTHRAVISSLRAFALNDFNKQWTDDYAETTLIGFLSQASVAVLAADLEGAPPPSDAVDSRARLIVSRFIARAAAEQPDTFGYIATVAKGLMLSNVLYLPGTFERAEQRFGHDVDVYLDTPFVLRALEYTSPELAAPCVELLVLLQQQSARLRVFDHTYSEIEGVLRGAGAAYKQRAKARFEGDVVEYFIREELSESDVELFLAQLPERLESAGIRVIPTPPYEERFGVDEKKLEAHLVEKIGYRNDDAMIRDIGSLTAIHRLRAGRVYTRLEQTPAILVTTNAQLAYTSGRFFAQEHGASAVPYCVPDHLFTAITWLKAPRTAPDLPVRQVLADSYAAINPSDALWRRYLSEIRRLIARGDVREEDGTLLVFSREARDALVDVTGNDASAFGEGTVEQVLAIARANARSEVEEELRLTRVAHAAEVAEREGEIDDSRKEADELARRLAEAHARTERLIGGIAGAAAWTLVVPLFALVAAALVVATALAIDGVVPAKWSNAVPIVASICIVLGATLGLLNLVFGVSLVQLLHRLRSQIRTRVLRALKSRLTQ